MNGNAIASQHSTRALKMLLLVCAGALIIIIVTFAADVHEAQKHQLANTASQAEFFCGMSLPQFKALPDALKNHLRAQCVLDEVNEIR